MANSIKNISISETSTGHIIFQRVYSWKAASAFSNLGSFIRGLYQFAREIDDGVISGVDFEYSSRNIVRHKRDDVLRRDQGDTMHMMTMKTEDIIVTIFYDMRGEIKLNEYDQWKCEVMLNAVKSSFEIKHLQTLQILHKEIRAESGDTIQQSNNTEEPVISMHHFDDFTDIADYLYEQIFGRSEEGEEPEEGEYDNALLRPPYSLSIDDQVHLFLSQLNLISTEHNNAGRAESPSVTVDSF